MNFECCVTRKKKDLELGCKKDCLPENICTSKREIKCSCITCINYGIKPLVRQAIVNTKRFYFCSDKCWEEWVKTPYRINLSPQYTLLSPISNPSPQNLEELNKQVNISGIPDLSI